MSLVANGESKAIRLVTESGNLPLTVNSLIDEFKLLGIRNDMTIITHSSLSSFGYICGGAISVILALYNILDIPMYNKNNNNIEYNHGTLVMPSFSAAYSNAEYWQNPPVPLSWLDIIENEWPGFHPDITPTRDMGRIAELFRGLPQVKRSFHPLCSFSCIGKNSNSIISNHSLEDHLGKQSPLGRIYDLKGYILLLGVNHNSNTSLHLSEYIFHENQKTLEKNQIKQHSPVLDNKGERILLQYSILDVNEDNFPDIADDFIKYCKENNKHDWFKQRKIGLANVQLIYQPALVDFGIKWMINNKK